MALFEIGSVADEVAADASGRRDTVVPQRSDMCTDIADRLLDAVRRSLQPGDPVARLLAAWPLTPAPGVSIPRTRPVPARSTPEVTT